MVSLQWIVVALTLVTVVLTCVSVLILISNLTLTYISFKSESLGDAASREQVMRERFEGLQNEYELPHHRELKIFEPRVRDFGFYEWVKALRPKANYPGFTHFSIKIRHTDWPDLRERVDSNNTISNPRFIYPDKEELQNNEKLQRLGVILVETRREPKWDADGKVLLDPSIEYRIYADTADPDTIEELQGSIFEVILELEFGKEIIEFMDPIRTRKDFEKRRKAAESVCDDSEGEDESVEDYEES